MPQNRRNQLEMELDVPWKGCTVENLRIVEPRNHFADLPTEMKMRIFGFVDSNSKLTARLVSKDFKNHVDAIKMHYEQLAIDSKEEGIEIFLQIRENEYSMLYNPTEHGYSAVYIPTEDGWSVESAERKRITYHRRGNHVDAAVSQFVKLLKNPRIFIEQVCILFNVLEFKAGLLKALEAEMKLLKHRVPVRQIRMMSFEKIGDILTFLPYLTPGTLEKLHFGCRVDNYVPRNPTYDEKKFRRILALEQWKQAQTVVMGDCVMAFPLEKMDHLQVVCCTLPRFDSEDVRRIVENMIRPGGWEHRTLEWMDFDEQKFIDYVTGPLLDQIGPDYETTVDKYYDDTGIMNEMVVKIRGMGRKIRITLDYSHYRSFGPRSVCFSNCETSKFHCPVYTREMMQREDDEEEERERKWEEKKKAAEKLKRRQITDHWNRYREKPRFEERKPAENQKNQKNSQFQPRPTGGKGQRK